MIKLSPYVKTDGRLARGHEFCLWREWILENGNSETPFPPLELRHKKSNLHIVRIKRANKNIQSYNEMCNASKFVYLFEILGTLQQSDWVGKNKLLGIRHILDYG
jgi:hypothetical protein